MVAEAPGSLTEALLVYVEPLASGAHAIVVGDATSVIAGRLLDLGARSVHVYDPDPARVASAAMSAPRGVTVRGLAGVHDVRDGVFDLAVIPDLAVLADTRATIGRLGRAVAPRGAVVAMGRATLEEAPSSPPFSAELGPAALDYSELYDVFASEFDDVSLVGVVPFRGVVFAELGTEDEAPAVSVDTRLAQGDAPSVFVVVASSAASAGFGRQELDPYAIVQLPDDGEPTDQAVAALAGIEADALEAQIDELKEEVAAREMRLAETVALVERSTNDRDAALTRAMELEAVLTAAQQAMATLERRLLEAERGCLDRDDRIATLSAEIDSRDSAASQPQIEEDERAREAEAAAFEAQLVDRARTIAELEKEVVRRERLVKELVTALEEAREGQPGPAFEVAAPLSPPASRRPPEAPAASTEEVQALRQKLDELAKEVARREGELTARAWRIEELENALRADRPDGRRAKGEDADLRKVLDEVDALRKALAQEHEARVAAESGEELARARSELARQATLLEQMRGRAESA